jgi:hypothetical protein
MTGLLAVFGSFSSSGRFQWAFEATHYKFVQGGPICCCLLQEVAALSYYFAALSGQFLPQEGGAIQF